MCDIETSKVPPGLYIFEYVIGVVPSVRRDLVQELRKVSNNTILLTTG